jgi:hypothetical protein
MRKLVLIVLAIAFTLPGSVFGQRTTTSISGTITDPSGAVVPGAQVTAIETSTGTTTLGKASSDGFYILTNLRPGTYRLRVEQPGFQSYVQEGITLEVDRPATINVALQVGTQAQSVTVSSTAPQVDVRTGELNTLITGNMAVDLPLNGRNVLQLMTLSPDISPSTPPGATIAYDQIAIRPEATSVFMSASGGRGNSTGFYLDGGIDEDTYDQVANVYPNPDAIQEFSYETNNYSARYGGRGGGVVNAVTKSGTNQFHGTAFEFVRNGDLNARNFFASENDGLKRNQYGGTVGGPVEKNKMFFFASWQGTKLRSAPTQNVAVTATAAELNGDFSALCPGGFDASGICPSANGTQLVNPSNNQPFPNNQIPTTDFDPVAQKVLSLVPLGAPETGIAYYATRMVQNDNQVVTRVDRNFGNKLRFSARYLYDDLDVPAESITSDLLTANKNNTWRSQNITANAEYLLRPNLISTLTATYNRVINKETGPTGFPSWTQLGVNVPNNSVFPNESDPVLSIGGYFGTNWIGLYRYPSAEYEFENNWTYVRSGHTLQFGVDIKYNERTTEDQDYLGQGYFTFNGQISGNNLSDFLLGKPDSFTQTLLTENTMQRDVPAWYVADAWKVGRKLTLTLGVRWNPWIPLHETTGNKVGIFSQADYDQGIVSKRFPLAPPGLLFAGDPGVPDTATPTSFRVFDPRIGFAYDPFGNGRTAIRGGFGIFHDEPFTNGWNGPAGSIPFILQSSIPFPVSLDNPYSTPGFPNIFAGHPNLNTQPWPEPFFVYADDPHFTYTSIQQWNLTVERQLTPSLMFRTAYEASETYHQFNTVEADPAVYIPGQSTLENVQSRRIDPQFTNIAQAVSDGTASYNALLVSVEKRMSHGLSLTAGFRWAKSLDEASDCEGDENIADPFNLKVSRGPSNFNIAKQFILSSLYALPTVQSWGFVGRQVLGGWHLNSIVTVRSGFPYQINSGIANSMIGSECGGGCEFADIVGNPYLPSNRPLSQRLSEWFNPAAFTYNAIGTFGNAPRNFLIGPTFADVDMGLVKSFPIKKGPFAETQKIDFRAEFFNIFNRANFFNPQQTVTDGPTFGTILGAYDPRIIQFALKYTF